MYMKKAAELISTKHFNDSGLRDDFSEKSFFPSLTHNIFLNQVKLHKSAGRFKTMRLMRHVFGVHSEFTNY